jgi:hypothetical protein
MKKGVIEIEETDEVKRQDSFSGMPLMITEE